MERGLIAGAVLAALLATTTAAAETPKVTPVAYVEAYAAYNANRPGNGITNARGFDNRHGTFALSNAVLGADASTGDVYARVTLQIGSTPATYYAAEPRRAGTPFSAATGPELWRLLQEAYAGWKIPALKGLDLRAGLFGSPIGREVFAVKDDWNWSRSNAFFALPYYHTGLTASLPLGGAWSATAGVVNGWNSIVDGNDAKSVMAHVDYDGDAVDAHALYFGGIERPDGAPEGPQWRHHVDVHARVRATRRLELAAQGDGGFEDGRLGLARWWGFAGYARAHVAPRVWLAFRGDRFTEHVGTRSTTPLFFGGVEWVTSATLTLETRPVDHLSLRLEGRHDLAEAPLFFRGAVAGLGTDASPYVANARAQSTVLVGATAWF